MKRRSLKEAAHNILPLKEVLPLSQMGSSFRSIVGVIGRQGREGFLFFTHFLLVMCDTADTLYRYLKTRYDTVSRYGWFL